MSPVEVIAVFDIGKSNKKLLLFDASLKIVLQQEQQFPETRDDDGFECDDMDVLEQWMKESLSGIVRNKDFVVKALNFSTYGASLMHLDAAGHALTPVYNYLKPMPAEVLDGFYEKYGGPEEFCRNTASPALGMLNSGLQVLWLKRKKPGVYKNIRYSLHLPQYASWLFTGRVASEYTSIGCHTAMWDFDRQAYHPWLKDEDIRLPDPESNYHVTDIRIEGSMIKTGIGIHDSSASLVPYLDGCREQFILVSTGTWCIFMNPFNHEPLTAEELRRDTLCYMSVHQKPVKSSRLFLGHIHDVNVEKISAWFGSKHGDYKNFRPKVEICEKLVREKKHVFFSHGIPPDYIDLQADLSNFNTYLDAYHHFIFDVASLAIDSLELILAKDDQTRKIFITGGFARNELFVWFMSALLPGKEVICSEIDNATALGAAMTVYEAAFGKEVPEISLL